MHHDQPINPQSVRQEADEQSTTTEEPAAMVKPVSTTTTAVQAVRPASTKRKPTPIAKRTDGRERAVASAWVDANTLAEIDRLAALNPDGPSKTRSAVVREAIEEFVAKRSFATVA